MKLGEPYDSMVVRVHEGCIRLLGQARKGSRAGTGAEARRLLGQVAALAELLEPVPVGFLDADGKLVTPVLPVSVRDLTERRGN